MQQYQVVTVFIAAIIGLAVHEARDYIKGYFDPPARLSAEVVSTPYRSLIAQREIGDPSFQEDAATVVAKLPPQFDKYVLKRVVERAAQFDAAAITARAECVHQVKVRNATRKPVKSITVTADVITAYSEPRGRVTVIPSSDANARIERIDPGETREILLFSVLDCNSYGEEVRVFNDDDSADVTVTGSPSLFVIFLAEKWPWLAAVIVFLFALSAVAEGQLRKENEKLKEQLAVLSNNPGEKGETAIPAVPQTSANGPPNAGLG